MKKKNEKRLSSEVVKEVEEKAVKVDKKRDLKAKDKAD